MQAAPMRHWHLPDTHNVRDLGGYPRVGGGTTQWGRILRGDSLNHLRAESCRILVERGLTTVIDLRRPDEIGAEPNPFAGHERVAYLNIALFDALAPVSALAGSFDMAERYREALDRCGDRLADALMAIATAPAGLVLFHCTAGKDRTGVLAALILLVAGVDETQISADYSLTASLANPLLARLRHRALAAGLEAAHVERVLASDAATMAAMLAYLREVHGGIEAYMSRIGLTPADTGRLVARLCA
jgi:protein-tyrosine phosphatase